VRTPHQVEALLASELPCIEVERSGKTESAALRSPDPDACRDPRVAQVELPPAAIRSSALWKQAA
jgi:hypothetical protein